MKNWKWNKIEENEEVLKKKKMMKMKNEKNGKWWNVVMKWNDEKLKWKWKMKK